MVSSLLSDSGHPFRATRPRGMRGGEDVGDLAARGIISAYRNKQDLLSGAKEGTWKARIKLTVLSTHLCAPYKTNTQ